MYGAFVGLAGSALTHMAKWTANPRHHLRVHPTRAVLARADLTRVGAS